MGSIPIQDYGSGILKIRNAPIPTSRCVNITLLKAFRQQLLLAALADTTPQHRKRAGFFSRHCHEFVQIRGQVFNNYIFSDDTNAQQDRQGSRVRRHKA